MSECINRPVNVWLYTELILNELVPGLQCFHCFKVLHSCFVMHDVMASNKLDLAPFHNSFELIFFLLASFIQPSFQKDDLCQVELIAFILIKSLSKSPEEAPSLRLIEFVILLHPTGILVGVVEHMDLDLESS